jgi:hypothetical protein
MKRIALALCLTAIPMAVGAQTPSAAATVAAPDPARLAVARQLVAQMVTDSSIQRMFGGLDRVMSAQMITAFVPAGDLAKARAADPYLDERMKRVTKVTFDYLREMMVDVLPEIREAMASSFASKLSIEELRTDLAFAKTPAGQHLFASFYEVMQDPAYIAFVQNFMSRLAGARTDLIEKIKAATADLPPPPKPAK